MASANISEKGRVVLQFMADYPEESVRAISRLVYKERPDLFNDVDHVRTIVRYHRGSLGDANRRKIKKAGNPSEEMKKVMRKYNLAPEITTETKDRTIKEEGLIGVISDLHIPYHDYEALEAVLVYFKEKGIKSLIFNGDYIDFYQASDFDRDPGRANLSYEIEMGNELWELIRAEFGDDLNIYYKIGNHEERYRRFMLKKAKELYNIDAFRFANIMNLNDYNIKLIGGRQKMIIGDLDLIHGHELGFNYSPVSPAKALFNRVHSHSAMGHVHQTSVYNKNNFRRGKMTTYSSGCLCELDPYYRPYGYLTWNLGAMLLEVQSDGKTVVDNFQVENGKVVNSIF